MNTPKSFLHAKALRICAAIMAFAITTGASAKADAAELGRQFALTANPKAMTWVLEVPVVTSVGRRFALVGSDAKTNTYAGDTIDLTPLPVLCISDDGLSKPGFNLGTFTTPGGALRNSWSGGRLFFTTPTNAKLITSKTVGNQFCQTEAKAKKMLFPTKFRMAEFHDGDKKAGWTGWGFWGDVTEFLSKPGSKMPVATKDRFWVAIDGAPSNLWD